MRLFGCAVCGQLLYFENHRCERCGHHLGFLPDRLQLSPVEFRGGGILEPAIALGTAWRSCGNAEAVGCNWLVPDHAAGQPWCIACSLNRTIPDLSIAANVVRWQILERAKRRLVYGLLRLGLPVVSQGEDPSGLAFDFLADPPPGAGPPVLTGHKGGIVTINVAEADPVEGVRRREQLDEPYRTVLGHFRHEVAHHYWERLVRDGPELAAFRAVFGDERQDYEAALARHYANGPPADWPSRFISAYAAAHPWEDWAETFAHYLHIVDTLETAQAFGVRIDPALAPSPEVDIHLLGDPYRAPSARVLVGAWLPLTFAVNSLNRSMGLGDLYPFMLLAPAIAKLEAVHEFLRRAAATRG